MNRTTRPLPVAAALLFGFFASLPGAYAHGAPPPPEYQRRLLHDCNDDYFGGDVAGEVNGHDLITLDLQEAYDSALAADVLRFRLAMDGGFGGGGRPTLRDEVGFAAGDRRFAYEFTTTDNAKFTGTFDRIDGPNPLRTGDGAQDGTRFHVEGVVKLTTLGLAPGAVIQDYRVEGSVDGATGDYMPGTYRTQLGAEAPAATACPEGESQTRYEAGPHTLQGPTGYVRVAFEPAQTEVPVDGNATVSLRIQNLLKDHAQTVSVALTAPAGVQARFETEGGSGETHTEAVAKGSTLLLAVTLRATDTATPGTVTASTTTDLGGREVSALAVRTRGPSGSAPGSPTDPGDGGREDAQPRQSPSSGVLGVVAGLWLAQLLPSRSRRPSRKRPTA